MRKPCVSKVEASNHMYTFYIYIYILSVIFVLTQSFLLKAWRPTVISYFSVEVEFGPRSHEFSVYTRASRCIRCV